MSFQVIVTVGPSLLANDASLRTIDTLGDCLYRLNGAHVAPELLPRLVAQLREVVGDRAIVLDLPGNKIRTANLAVPMTLKRGQMYRIATDYVNFPGVLALVGPGDRILADSGNLVLDVVDASPSGIDVVARSDGTLSNNRGLHIEGASTHLPFLSERDLALIERGIAAQVDCLALSYVRNREDIRQVKALAPAHLELIAKIETRAAVDNLAEILDEVNVVNVDRGDLASEIGITHIGRAQHGVVAQARAAGKRVFLATQFLGAMQRSPTPLIPEVLDLETTIRSGVSGIQLSEETAIGEYAIECVELVFEMWKQVTTMSWSEAEKWTTPRSTKG